MAESQVNAAIRLYDSLASDYDNSWHPSFVRRFASYLDLQPGQHVLDLACGTGLLSFIEADAVGPQGRVVGIDISPGMLTQGNAKKQKEGMKYLHVEFHQGDILNLGAIQALQYQTAFAAQEWLNSDARG